MIAKLGLTAAMLPVVTSIVAPTALQAQSLSSQTFIYTGAGQTYTVPAGVTTVTIDGLGAAIGRAEPGLQQEPGWPGASHYRRDARRIADRERWRRRSA